MRVSVLALTSFLLQASAGGAFAPTSTAFVVRKAKSVTDRSMTEKTTSAAAAAAAAAAARQHESGCSCASCSSGTALAAHRAGCGCDSCTSHAPGSSSSSTIIHNDGCDCAACRSLTALAAHGRSPCNCGACNKKRYGFSSGITTSLPARRATMLCSSAEDVEEAPVAAAAVPAEVEALDGIEGPDEAHNAERPARKSLKKKGPRGKPLSEFTAGESVTGKVRALASYGAFVDIGAQTDGLLHISQLSVEYVADVTAILEVGQQVTVRIASIDEKKGQVALSLLSEQEQAQAQEQQQQQQQQRPQRNNRRDDSAVRDKLAEKGWDAGQFVEGTVVSTVDFGAFVRIDAATLNSEVEGQLDGLVHISALANTRVDSVTSVVNADDKVKIRVKEIANGKVSLSMVSVEDEAAKAESYAARSGRGPGPVEGNKNWQEDMDKLLEDGPVFSNRPLVMDLR